MAFITKKKSKYSTYYVIIENARVNGQPKVVKQWYLGTIDKIIKMAEGSEEKVQPREIDCVEYGSVAALCRIADELGLRDIVNSISDKKRKQPGNNNIQRRNEKRKNTQHRAGSINRDKRQKRKT